MHGPSADPVRETLDVYERHAARYIERTPARRSALLDALIDLLAPGAAELELGSGPGRDADALEASGLVVDRTDGATSFVEHQRAAGHDARVLNVLADDFGGPYDAVFANAVLLHTPRDRLRGVLEVARRATRVGGLLAASFKKGAGEGWSDHKLDEPRHFTYWAEDDLRRVVIDAGWMPTSIVESIAATSADRWIDVIAHNGDRRAQLSRTNDRSG